MEDDWNDDKTVISLAGIRILKKRFKRIEKKYPKKCQVIQTCLHELHSLEVNKERSLDLISTPFGKLMAEMFLYKEDEWSRPLQQFGFYLGKYIYLLDAYDDIKKDLKDRSYNPFIESNQSNISKDQCRDLLTILMGECTKAFESLPLIWEVEILRNILYSGVWRKFDRHLTS